MYISSQLRSASFENLASDPVTGLAKGRVYFNTTSNVFRMYDGTSWLTVASTSVVSDSVDAYKIKNHSITASVAANALTIALKQADGTDATGGSPIKIVFRNATLGTGSTVERTVSAALSTVVSSGSTLGSISGKENVIHVYAIDNAGTVELAYSAMRCPDLNGVISTTAEGGGGAADSAVVIYSTAARTNVAAVYLGCIRSTQATAGTWATAPSLIDSNPNSHKGKCLVLASNSTSGQSISSGSYTVISLDAEAIDTHSAFSSSVFTAPFTDWYRVSGHTTYEATTGVYTCSVQINKNGSFFAQFHGGQKDGTASEIHGMAFSLPIFLHSGETMAILAGQTSSGGSARTLLGDNSASYVTHASIESLGLTL